MTPLTPPPPPNTDIVAMCWRGGQSAVGNDSQETLEETNFLAMYSEVKPKESDETVSFNFVFSCLPGCTLQLIAIHM